MLFTILLPRLKSKRFFKPFSTKFNDYLPVSFLRYEKLDDFFDESERKLISNTNSPVKGILTKLINDISTECSRELKEHEARDSKKLTDSIQLVGQITKKSILNTDISDILHTELALKGYQFNQTNFYHFFKTMETTSQENDRTGSDEIQFRISYDDSMIKDCGASDTSGYSKPVKSMTCNKKCLIAYINAYFMRIESIFQDSKKQVSCCPYEWLIGTNHEKTLVDFLAYGGKCHKFCSYDEHLEGKRYVDKEGNVINIDPLNDEKSSKSSYDPKVESILYGVNYFRNDSFSLKKFCERQKTTDEATEHLRAASYFCKQSYKYRQQLFCDLNIKHQTLEKDLINCEFAYLNSTCFKGTTVRPQERSGLNPNKNHDGECDSDAINLYQSQALSFPQLMWDTNLNPVINFDTFYSDAQPPRTFKDKLCLVFDQTPIDKILGPLMYKRQNQKSSDLNVRIPRIQITPKKLTTLYPISDRFVGVAPELRMVCEECRCSKDLQWDTSTAEFFCNATLNSYYKNQQVDRYKDLHPLLWPRCQAFQMSIPNGDFPKDAGNAWKDSNCQSSSPDMWLKCAFLNFPDPNYMYDVMEAHTNVRLFNVEMDIAVRPNSNSEEIYSVTIDMQNRRELYSGQGGLFTRRLGHGGFGMYNSSREGNVIMFDMNIDGTSLSQVLQIDRNKHAFIKKRKRNFDMDPDAQLYMVQNGIQYVELPSDIASFENQHVSATPKAGLGYMLWDYGQNRFVILVKVFNEFLCKIYNLRKKIKI